MILENIAPRDCMECNTTEPSEFQGPLFGLWHGTGTTEPPSYSAIFSSFVALLYRKRMKKICLDHPTTQIVIAFVSEKTPSCLLGFPPLQMVRLPPGRRNRKTPSHCFLKMTRLNEDPSVKKDRKSMRHRPPKIQKLAQAPMSEEPSLAVGT